MANQHPESVQKSDSPTIKTIAAHAGVSRGTVDRVLHGRPSVKEDKRQRVLAAIHELGYSPNTAARALALKGRNVKIAVLLPDWSGHFETEVKRGIEAAVLDNKDFGIDVILRQCKTSLPEECAQQIDDLRRQNISGLALCAKDSMLLRQKLEELHEAGLPVVTLNSDIPNARRMCFVGEDYTKSGRIAAEIMSKLTVPGDAMLLVLGNREFDSHFGRMNGFCQRFAEMGRQLPEEHILESYNEYNVTYQKVHAILQQNPAIKAIYMANESVPGCIDAVENAGMTGKIHIVCHDLPQYTIRYLREGRVDFSIEQNIFAQGYESISILQNFILADKKPDQNTNNPPLLIINAENID